MPHPCLGGNCLPRVCGNWDRDLAALTPRCAAGPYRWSMGNPAHTATQGVNLRIQGPKYPPIGPITPPISRALPPSMHAREDEADTGNERPPRASRAHTHAKWRRPRHVCTDDAGNGADNGTTPRDLAALTPRCAAGPYRWSIGSPAHTATQGVNLRNQGPKHPPIGPNTPPIPRAMPPSTHARTRPTPATGPTTEPPPETWQH